MSVRVITINSLEGPQNPRTSTRHRKLARERTLFVVSNGDAEEVPNRPHILYGKGIM